MYILRLLNYLHETLMYLESHARHLNNIYKHRHVSLKNCIIDTLEAFEAPSNGNFANNILLRYNNPVCILKRKKEAKTNVSVYKQFNFDT